MILQSMLGVICLAVIAWLCPEKRRVVNWQPVIGGRRSWSSVSGPSWPARWWESYLKERWLPLARVTLKALKNGLPPENNPYENIQNWVY